MDEKVTYHDPQHLGRHNKIYVLLRELVASIPGVNLPVEMERSVEKSFAVSRWRTHVDGRDDWRTRQREPFRRGDRHWRDQDRGGLPVCNVMLNDGTTNASKKVASEDIEVSTSPRCCSTPSRSRAAGVVGFQLSN